MIFKWFINLFRNDVDKHDYEVPTDGGLAQEEGYKLSDNPYLKSNAMHSIWRDDWLFSRGISLEDSRGFK